jgi:hypothetical protein
MNLVKLNIIELKYLFFLNIYYLGFDPCSLFMSALAPDIEDERRPLPSTISYRQPTNLYNNYSSQYTPTTTTNQSIGQMNPPTGQMNPSWLTHQQQYQQHYHDQQPTIHSNGTTPQKQQQQQQQRYPISFSKLILFNRFFLFFFFLIRWFIAKTDVE